MGAGGLQAAVVGIGRAVAPGAAVGRGGGLDRRSGVPRVALDLGQDVVGVGLGEGIGPAFGGVPGVLQQVARLGGVALLPAQLRQGNQRRQFFLDQMHCPGTSQGVE